jgi:site-specific DNA-methyltransferase (adenine-specific)
MKNVNIFQGDCIDIDKRIASESVDLGIFDPPFGLGESTFDKHYKRDENNVIDGYREAPEDYEKWTFDWLSEACRVLKSNGSMYVFMGHTNLRHLLNAAHKLNLFEINHLIWKYNFGVYTNKKFVTSHYHVLYYKKSKKSQVKFNTFCRFGSQEKDDKNGSLLYQDLEDVFFVNREYAFGEKKNQNKLPEEVIRKLILYSSNENDLVCDFFMGNFTTAFVAKKLGRKVTGYEINKNSYELNMPKLETVEYGCDLKKLKKVENLKPLNQGKKISKEEIDSIKKDYLSMLEEGYKKGNIHLELQKKYGRGRFSIKNIIDKCLF